MRFNYEFDTNEFSKRIKTKRVIDLDIDMRELFSQTGVSIATISRVERGAMPELSNLIKLCNWLQESPSVFFKSKEVRSKRKTAKSL